MIYGMSRVFSVLSLLLCMRSGLAAIDTDTVIRKNILYTGTEYVKQFNSSKGSPFFPSEVNKGSVRYFGNWYNDVEFLYDCEDDVVIIRDLQGQLKLQLVREKLDRFIIDGHHFIRLKLLSSRGEFYEILSEGRRSLMLQWEKKLSSNMKETDQYVLSKSLFIMEDGKIRKIEKTSDLFTVSPGREKEIRKLYKDSDLNFKKDPVKTSLSLLKDIEAKGW
jgi:hypothetical protein